MNFSDHGVNTVMLFCSCSVMSGMGDIVPETVITLWCCLMFDSILVHLGNGASGMAT